MKKTVTRTPIVLTQLLTASFLPIAACSPTPSPHEWKELVVTEGHANKIPASWVVTQEGKFAHAIKIPNPVPAESGYRKSMTAGEYFDHLCEKESGSFIFKTVENVDGFAMLRYVNGNSEEQQGDLWWQEAPGLQGRYTLQYDPLADASGFVDPPSFTYKYVELASEDKVGYLKIAEKIEWKQFNKVQKLDKPTSRYGVTWRGIRRDKDRENFIAGYEWLVLDLHTNEVLAVLRNFSQTGNTTNRKDGIHWQIARQCKVLQQISGSKLIRHDEVDWIPRVLKPTVYPKSLERIDQRLKDMK